MASVNNFIIDHVLRGIMLSTADGSYMWSINQITEPALNITSETAEAVDALGSRIATFNRGKSAEFSANNSIFDLGLFAAQNGVEKLEASAASKIQAPMFEEFEVATGDLTHVLAETPTDDIEKVYKLNGDGTLGNVYETAAAASSSKFGWDSTSKTLTYPTSTGAPEPGTRFIVIYDYMCENGSAVIADAVNFPKAGRFILEVLGTDVCDPTTLIHAYLDFPNAKLDANVDITFATDGNHPFTIQCQQAYCDAQKVLYKLIVPKED